MFCGQRIGFLQLPNTFSYMRLLVGNHQSLGIFRFCVKLIDQSCLSGMGPLAFWSSKKRAICRKLFLIFLLFWAGPILKEKNFFLWMSLLPILILQESLRPVLFLIEKS